MAHVTDTFPAIKLISQGEEIKFDQVILILVHKAIFAIPKDEDKFDADAHFLARTKNGEPVLFESLDGERNTQLPVGDVYFHTSVSNRLLIAILQFATGKKIICKCIPGESGSGISMTSFETEA